MDTKTVPINSANVSVRRRDEPRLISAGTSRQEVHCGGPLCPVSSAVAISGLHSFLWLRSRHLFEDTDWNSWQMWWDPRRLPRGQRSAGERMREPAGDAGPAPEETALLRHSPGMVRRPVRS